MTAHVVGCGESGKHWPEFWKEGDISMGVNDAGKWGKDFDYLFLIDNMMNFRNEPDRIAEIRKSKANIVTLGHSWKPIFKDYEVVKVQPFTKRLVKGKLYHSQTSTFVAACYAFNLGAMDIILHGVDLNTHKTLSAGKRATDHELFQYKNLAFFMKQQGVLLTVSSKESQLYHVGIPCSEITVRCLSLLRKAEAMARGESNSLLT